MFYIYILHSPEHDRYYTGYSGDIERRLCDHNGGTVKSTKPFRPWVLVYSEEFDNATDARRRENKIKSYKGGEVFKQLVSRPR